MLDARFPVRVLLALVAWLPLATFAEPDRRSAIPLDAFPRERIAIETHASFRQPIFEAWRADTAQAREQGLMFVEDGGMDPNEAMIFVYEPPQFVSMWMKNTLLSLDLLFADDNGCIVTIKERATPLSLAEIRSGKRVSLVVELKAGTVARHGITVGDRVLRPETGPEAAAGITCARAPATR